MLSPQLFEKVHDIKRILEVPVAREYPLISLLRCLVLGKIEIN
jgi:hypothetical protein